MTALTSSKQGRRKHEQCADVFCHHVDWFNKQFTEFGMLFGLFWMEMRVGVGSVISHGFNQAYGHGQ